MNFVTLRRSNMGNSVAFKRVDGTTLNGYLAEPAGNPNAPGVVVIQEWWGLNDQIRGVADRLALAGCRALVPDLYRGKSTIEAEEASHLMGALDFADAASQDVRGAVQHLKASGSSKVAVTGYCMGGALTILASTMVPELDAAVPWYGFPPLDYVDASKIKAPMMAHWATQDAVFPIATVDDLEKKLAAAGVAYEGHRYLAYHAFANETAQGPRRIEVTQYDAAWAQIAWDRTLRFFGRTIG
ncbi:MAG: dienelactone hydrolase family protein [Betaproteobacteria bacterium]|nr:MAG: dienelactone hydrolase family protein [Betaproteobacteria bacterium]